MNYYENNIRHVKGNTYSSALVLEGIDQDLESAYFSCRDGLNEDSPLLFEKSLGNGISLVEYDEENQIRKYMIRIAPADTKDLQSGTYYYDLQVGVNGDVFTIMKGRFILYQDATKKDQPEDDPEAYIKLILDGINGEVIGTSVVAKTNYLSETKSLIAQAINNLGGEITDQTTFRNYKNKLNNIYDNIPKTDFEEGSEIKLENCLKGKLDFDTDTNNYKKIVLGDKSKNLFSGFTKGIRINHTTGAEESSPNGASSDYIPVNFGANENYYISGLLDTIHSEIWAYNLNKQSLGRTGNNNRSEMLLGPSSFPYGTPQGTGDIAYIRVCQRVETGDTGTISDIDTIQTMFEVGSTATKWQPYGGIVAGNQEVVVRGINKLSSANAETKTNNDFSVTCDGKGAYTINSIPTGQYREVAFTLKENYTIQNGDYLQLNADFLEYRANIQLKDTSNNQIVLKTYTQAQAIVDLSEHVGETIKYIAIGCSNTAEYKGTLKPVICNSSTQVPFEEYITPITKTLSLGEIQLEDADYIGYDVTNDKFYKIINNTATEITDTTLKGQLKEWYYAKSNNGTTIVEVTGNLPARLKIRALKGGEVNA